MKSFMVNKKKRTMKKSEAILISLVLLVGINAFTLTFFVSHRYETYTQKTEELSQVQARFHQLQTKYKSYDTLQAQLKNIGFRKQRVLSELPEAIYEENILFDISEIAAMSEISIGSIVMGSGESMDIEGVYIDTDQPSESLQPIRSYISMQDLSLKISGEIDDLYTFIKSIEQSTQMTAVTGLNIVPGQAKKFSGNMTLKYLACEEGLFENSVIPLPEMFGKGNPFRPYAGYTGLNIDVGEAQLPQEEDPADFVIQILDYKDGLPSYIMGPFDKISKEIYAEKFGEIKGHLSLKEQSGMMILEYGFDGDMFDQEEFPMESNIIIDIYSRDRYMDGDIQMLYLDFENYTGQSVSFRIKDDDTEKPLIELNEINRSDDWDEESIKE